MSGWHGCAGKNRYATDHEAQRAIRWAQKQNNPGARWLRVYSCSKCDGWHLTKQRTRSQRKAFHQAAGCTEQERASRRVVELEARVAEARRRRNEATGEDRVWAEREVVAARAELRIALDARAATKESA